VWIKQLKTTHALYEEKDSQYWRAKIVESNGNMKKLWQTMAVIMGEKPGCRYEDDDCTADDFAKYFLDKVRGSCRKKIFQD